MDVLDVPEGAKVSDLIAAMTDRDMKEFRTVGGNPGRLEVAFLSNAIMDSIAGIVSAVSSMEGVNAKSLDGLREAVDALKEALILQRFILSKVDPAFAKKLADALKNRET